MLVFFLFNFCLIFFWFYRSFAPLLHRLVSTHIFSPRLEPLPKTPSQTALTKVSQKPKSKRGERMPTNRGIKASCKPLFVNFLCIFFDIRLNIRPNSLARQRMINERCPGVALNFCRCIMATHSSHDVSSKVNPSNR